MPIYAYRCSVCGHAKDALQKMSDAPLKVCPACGAEALVKQVTAAGFQLKGTGWYATDFKNGPAGARPQPQPASANAEASATAPDSGKSSATATADAAQPPAGPASPAAATTTTATTTT